MVPNVIRRTSVLVKSVYDTRLFKTGSHPQFKLYLACVHIAIFSWTSSLTNWLIFKSYIRIWKKRNKFQIDERFNGRVQNSDICSTRGHEHLFIYSFLLWCSNLKINNGWYKRQFSISIKQQNQTTFFKESTR